jgi:hypothetical protein
MGVLDNLQVSTLSSDEEVMNDENNQMDDQFDITNNENMLSVKIDNYTIHSSSAITGQQSIGNIFYRFLFTFIIVSALTLQEPSLSVSSTSLLPRPPTQNVNSNFGSPPQLGGGVFGFGSPPHLGISAIQTHQPSSSLLNRGFSGGHNSIFSNNDTG